ncbi:hypothetical protein [Caulobacter sp. UC70_42]|uniref:hypothetical protein n=1 Tax=Caulobacter sp. UC70_42 TaxID=3374551 RepID=UPI003757F886
MTNEELDALLASSLPEPPREPDPDFVDHSAKRIAVRALLEREEKAAIQKGAWDLAVAVALIGTLLVWSGPYGDGLADIGVTMLVVGFWAFSHQWVFPDFSFGRDRTRDR